MEPTSKPNRTCIDMSETLGDSMKSLHEPLIITTKTYDGGYRISHRPSEDGYDAFMHYSDRDTRMKALFGAPPTSAREEPPVHHSRETRISFELHPSILLTDADLLICDHVIAPRS